MINKDCPFVFLLGLTYRERSRTEGYAGNNPPECEAASSLSFNAQAGQPWLRPALNGKDVLLG